MTSYNETDKEVVNEIVNWVKTTKTKIADKNGLPYICFHETNHGFKDAFTENNRGSGNYGRGFYFGVGFKYWEKYGVYMKNTFACILDVKKCYSLYAKKSLKRILYDLNIDVLTNMYKGSNKLKFTNGSAKHMLEEIINDIYIMTKGTGDFSKIRDTIWNRFIENKRNQGYDALIDQSLKNYPVILIFDSNQIRRLSAKDAKIIEAYRKNMITR